MRALAYQPTAMRLAFQDAGLFLSPKNKAGLKPIKQFWTVTHKGKRIVRNKRRKSVSPS